MNRKLEIEYWVWFWLFVTLHVFHKEIMKFPGNNVLQNWMGVCVRECAWVYASHIKKEDESSRNFDKELSILRWNNWATNVFVSRLNSNLCSCSLCSSNFERANRPDERPNSTGVTPLLLMHYCYIIGKNVPVK